MAPTLLYYNYIILCCYIIWCWFWPSVKAPQLIKQINTRLPNVFYFLCSKLIIISVCRKHTNKCVTRNGNWQKKLTTLSLFLMLPNCSFLILHCDFDFRILSFFISCCWKCALQIKLPNLTLPLLLVWHYHFTWMLTSTKIWLSRYECILNVYVAHILSFCWKGPKTHYALHLLSASASEMM